MNLLGSLLVVAAIGAVLANPESKYNEIIRLLSTTNHQNLNADAQTYSAAVVSPNSYSRPDRSRLSSSSAKAKEDEDAKRLAEEEEERKPDRLALLLAESKFTCRGVKNGYYADESVGCQVFHYCVDEVKHSWQCPENTVFHQIHLNCVPNTQDICAQSSKYHIVNDYLHKELDERGPNNTIMYHQRFYPEGFDFGGDTVSQIFAAQAQASLQKPTRQSQPDSDFSSYEDEPAPRPQRPRPKPQQFTFNSPSNVQSVRAQLVKPAYKPAASRPMAIPSGYTPSSPMSTRRPMSETFSPSGYTESSQDDHRNEYSPSSDSAGSNQASFSGNLRASTFNSPGSTFSAPSSSSSFSGHGGQSASFRAQTPSDQRRPHNNYRTLGVPIASFRVAPAQGYAPQASTVQEVNVEPISIASAYKSQQPISGYFY